MGVDPAFIQEVQHRPKLAGATIEADKIPLIDLSPLNPGNKEPIGAGAMEDLVGRVGEACKEWGFFQVINHGVPVECRQRIEKAAREFFGQPSEEKRKVRRDELNPLGYYDTEHTKNVRDWKEVFDFAADAPMIIPASDDDEVRRYLNQWPHYPPGMREACEEYVRHVQKLSYKLMELISLSVGLPASRFEGFFGKDETSFIRLNHYSPCPLPDQVLGVGRHKDAGTLTVLAQDDVGGLEVKSKSNGEWVRVEPIPNSFIINVGDMIQVWTNDKYQSVEHRVVVNSEKERFSIPFFLNPAHYTMVEPLEELIDEQNPPRYKPFNWGKFFATRKLSNFKKLNVDNIQIYHFRIPE